MINRFKPKATNFCEETIINKKKEVIGVIRIKPSGVLWKPKGERFFYSVKLADFMAWIAHPETKAVRNIN
jgi:hypothetical protein